MPNSIDINGIPYRLNTDYRSGVEYAIMSAAGKITAADIFSIWLDFSDADERMQQHLENHIEEAIEGINRFYRREDKPVQPVKKETAEDESEENQRIPWEFSTDAGIIIAEFQRVYGIDLTSSSMHWWRFMALLEALYSYSFKDRVGFRVGDLSGMNAKQRAHAVKMRNTFEIHKDGNKTLDDHLSMLDEIIARHQTNET